MYDLQGNTSASHIVLSSNMHLSRTRLGYSCRQTKSSNLLTDFLGLQKVLELVDNGINGLLLMSFIDSNRQNFQKWQFMRFFTPKIWALPEKIAKNMKNIPIISFSFTLFNPIKIFPKIFIRNFLTTVGILPKLSHGQTQGLPEKDRIGPWFLFPQIYFKRVTNCTELIQIQLMWDTFGCVTCVENAQKFGQPKKAWEK